MKLKFIANWYASVCRVSFIVHWLKMIKLRKKIIQTASCHEMKLNSFYLQMQQRMANADVYFEGHIQSELFLSTWTLMLFTKSREFLKGSLNKNAESLQFFCVGNSTLSRKPLYLFLCKSTTNKSSFHALQYLHWKLIFHLGDQKTNLQSLVCQKKNNFASS